MPLPSATPRILGIRSWTEPLTELRAALRDAGVTVRITRVDIEPALNAALARSSYDIVVWDPHCHIAREIVDARLREHGRTAAIVVMEELGVTIANIVHTLTARF